MEVSYERQVRHNYLIIRADEIQKENYECRMLMANSIEGLLKFRFRQTETGIEFYYEITSRQPVNRILEGRTIKRQEIVKLIYSIAALLERLENYLLQESQILLDPQYIYTDPEIVQFFFCLVPDRKADFSKDMERLLQYLLKKTDHRDKESALLSYRLYQESQKEFYGMESLLKWLPLREDRELVCQIRDEINPEQREKSESTEKDFQEEAISAKEEKAEPRSGRNIQIAVTAAGVLLVPSLIWILKGTALMKEYWYGIVGWYGFWAAAAALKIVTAQVRRKKNSDKNKTQKTSFLGTEFSEEAGQREWETLIGNEAETFMEEQGADDEPVEEQEDPIFFETRVLSAEEGRDKSIRCLVSMDKKTEDIPVPYFPFLIGKQSGIVDYILTRDTVSRIHVKIEKNEKGYTLTDLNSTNGTWVRGKALMNNETVFLEEGDEIYIADCGFRFL